MLCQNCKRRRRCRSACAALSAHLQSLEGAQRELLLGPSALERVSDRVRCSAADFVEAGSGPWEKLTAAFPALPAPLVELFLLRYYQGVSAAEIARRQRVHYRTVVARLNRAIALMKRAGAGDSARPAVRWRTGDFSEGEKKFLTRGRE